MDLVMELAGCGPKEAAEALAKHKEIWLAVESLLEKPKVAGDKYIPPKPTVDHGMDADQKARCDRGRWLQDQVNAVFSVAHSKIQHEQEEQAHGAQTSQAAAVGDPKPSAAEGPASS